MVYDGQPSVADFDLQYNLLNDMNNVKQICKISISGLSCANESHLFVELTSIRIPHDRIEDHWTISSYMDYEFEVARFILFS